MTARRPGTRVLGGSILTALLFGALPAWAAGKTIEAEPLHEKKLRIDGLLREWGPLTELGVTVKGSGTRGSGMVGYDDQNLYVALKVSDAQISRTGAYGNKEDHATLYLAFPKTGGGYVTHELELYPGQPGKSAAAVRRGDQAVRGAKIVEAPGEGGYTLEASIPWAALPEAARIRVGLRGALRYTDADGGAVKSIVATSGATAGGALPPLPLEAEQGLDAALLRPKHLGAQPARALYGDVVGDGALERVAVYGGYLTITGHRYREGKQFYFAELGVSDASMVRRLELRDADGDGKSEIIVQKRFGAADKYREVLQVLKVGSDEVPAPVFQHEVGIKTPEGSVANKVQIKSRGKGFAIEISHDDAEGFEPGTYQEPKPGNMDSALLPWESVSSRTFEWRGSGFEKVDEKTQDAKPGKSAKLGGGKRQRRSDDGGRAEAPPPPRPPSADELQDRLYALYKQERGVKGGRPRFDFVTDVAGDGTAERVLVHDKDIVTFGKGFRGGTSYSFITIGVADAKDILDVTARDLTGDGKAEIIVRAVLHAKASKALGGDVVERHALLVYSVVDSALARIFGAETGRGLGKNKILGAVAFKPDGKRTAIELRPGRAIGWTEQSYPFPPDTTTAGGLEPLLLPWGDPEPRRYRWNGKSFAM